MVKGVVFLAVAALAIASGCDDSRPLPSIVAFCDGVCRGVVRCGGGPMHSCYDSCQADPDTQKGLGDVRPEAAAVVEGCLAELDCNTIFNGPFDACWDRARAETAASAHLRAFCPPYAAAAFECGYWFSVEDCQKQLTFWTDEFLDELAACTRAETCEATDACLEARFAGN